ncbi:MAG: hypothetical protein JST00_27850 [Deltaproteobacteria bacterium]|nr:hypothetical protein [Deltaproteobacteria bacterium]
MLRRLSLAPALVLALSLPRVAVAQTTRVASERSAYEEQRIDTALIKSGGEIDPEPEGKIVEDVEIVVLEVVEVDDPAPRFLNVFHTTTRKSILRREVLVKPGEAYHQYRVDETVRSLRTFQQMSLVIAVPLKGSAKDRVKVLLVTKDVWSLRANFDIKVGSAGLDLLRFEPTERNIAGTLDSGVTRFEMFPETITLGGIYLSPRFTSHRLFWQTEANVMFNRDSGHPEGSYGRLILATPQYSVDTKTLWSLNTSWNNVYVRRYVGARLADFEARSTPEPTLVPDKYHARELTETAMLVRSFGRAHKLDLGVGAELSVRRYVGLDPARYDAAVVDEYRRRRLPTSDDRAAPWVQARAYEGRFLRIHDFDVLGFEEDYRLGYDVWMRAYPVTRALGSSRNFLGLAGAAQYVAPLGDGMLRGTLEGLAELAVDDRKVPTLSVAAGVQLVTPRFGFARLVMDGVAIQRPRNYLNLRSSIGGEGRLRGYPTNGFLGENLVAFNIELRTSPIEILSCQVGAAAFFDMGDAFDSRDIRLKSSAGFGLRGLFPQLDRKVMRLDIAFPMVRDTFATGPVGFFIAFEQAIPVGGLSGIGASPAQGILNPTGAALQ